MNNELRGLVEKPIAHRGFHNETCPENSISAFERAINEQFTIELDVRLLKDGQIVVFHDNHLFRMTGCQKKISTCTYKEVKELRLANTEETIPLLHNVLKLVDGKVPILVELKNKGKAGALERKTFELLKSYKGIVCVQSFNPFSMAWFKKHAPELTRGLIVGDLEEKKNVYMHQKHLVSNLCFTQLCIPHFMSYDIFSSKRIPSRLKNKVFLGWTAKTKEQYEKGMSEFDNVIFEGFHPYE